MTSSSVSMIDRVYEAAAQLRWAAALEVPKLPAGGRIVVAGMGGSGMAARVAATTVPRFPVVVHQSYDLPEWAPDTVDLVIVVSYSGNTEEALSTANAALAAGIPFAAVTTGGALADRARAAGAPLVEIPDGLQPRAALAYQAGATTRLLAEVAGRDQEARRDLAVTADLLDDLLEGGDGPAVSLGRDIGDALYGRVAIVYGGHGIGSVAASRWKAQINENAKLPAYTGELPELDHNELTGWSSLPELGKRSVGIVMLRDPRGHPRIETRMRLTEEVLTDSVEIVGDVIAQGATALERFFSLAAVGDVASVRLAEIAGVDPTPVPVLENFKKRLAEAPQPDEGEA